MQHLSTHHQFQMVLSGRIVARTPHFVVHGLDTSSLDIADHHLFSGHALWMGVMVPKRWAKRAVTRNTIKRQIYAIGSEYESSFVSAAPLAVYSAAYVVRLRWGFDRVKYVSASSNVLKVAVRDELKCLFTQFAGRALTVASKGCA